MIDCVSLMQDIEMEKLKIKQLQLTAQLNNLNRTFDILPMRPPIYTTPFGRTIEQLPPNHIRRGDFIFRQFPINDEITLELCVEFKPLEEYSFAPRWCPFAI